MSVANPPETEVAVGGAAKTASFDSLLRPQRCGNHYVIAYMVVEGDEDANGPRREHTA